MLLQVGELAACSGLTVRTLHHYDSVGLLKPSARSESGYRLYDRNDVARLHGIQALRRMGLPLAEIGTLLAQGAGPLPALLDRQIAALDQEIDQARELQQRLLMLQLVIATGDQPEMGDWLDSLALMGTYAQYFDADELRRIFERWKPIESEWPPLVRDVREAMTRAVPFDSIELQPLVRRWMDLSGRWMDGDMDLIKRWGRMLNEQPSAPSRSGADRPLLQYMQAAVGHRMGVMGRYITPEQLERLDKTLGPQWRALGARADALLNAKVPPDSTEARTLAREWQALLDRTTRHDPVLRDKVLEAYAREPLLQAGAVFRHALLDYLQQALATADAPGTSPLPGFGELDGPGRPGDRDPSAASFA